MAEKTGTSATQKQAKPNPIPLIIGIVVVFVVIVVFMKTRRRPLPKEQAKLPVQDPCEGLPDWACGTVALLNPLAKTSVDIFKAKAQSDLELARLRA